MTLRFSLPAIALAAVASAAPPVVSLQPCPEEGFLPDAAPAADGTIHLVFHRGEAGASDIVHCTWSPESRQFSDPVRVNSTDGAAIAAGAVRGAHLAIGRDDSLHVAWMGSQQTAPGRDHHRMPMLYSRSLDGGKSFEAQRNVITSSYGLDGGGSLAADRKGNVHVLWHAAGSDQGAQHRKVVVASSKDNGESFAAENPIEIGKQGVCPCCGIRAAASPAGKFYVLFRGAPVPDQRGMNLLSFDPADGSSMLLHRDPWPIETCPVSSGAFSFGPAHVAVAWETDHRVKSGVFDATTGELLRSNESPEPLGKNHQKHPSVALSADGSVLVAWLEIAGWGRPGTLRWQHFSPGGHATDTKGQRELNVPWTRPVVVETGQGYAIFH